MVVLDEYKFKLGELSKTLEQANAQMRPEELKTELNGLEDQMSAADQDWIPEKLELGKMDMSAYTVPVPGTAK